MKHLVLASLVMVVMLAVGCEKKQEVAPIAPPPPPPPGASTGPGTDLPPIGAATGDTGTVAPLPATTTGTGKPGKHGKTYTITQEDAGKGYMHISRKVYGTPSRWKDIEAANPGVKLKIGTTINLPD